ncbi:MAG: hypothetical protein V4579_14380 [Pseudomonadota bacterium]
MRKLIKIVVPAVMAAGLFGAAGTASAQHYEGNWNRGDWNRGNWDRDHHDRGDYNNYRPSGRTDAIRHAISNLQDRIDRGERRDDISRREFASLRQELWSVRQQFRRFNRDGLSDREFQTLQYRLDRLRNRFHRERSDHDDRRW